MSFIKRWAWPVITVSIIVGLGWLVVTNINDVRHTPARPVPLTLGQLAQMSPTPRWVEVSNVVVDCSRTRRYGKDTDLVEVVDAQQPDLKLLLALEKHQLCVTVTVPVRAAIKNSESWRNSAAQGSGPLVGQTVFTSEDDLVKDEQFDVVASVVGLLVAALALGFQLFSRVGRRRGDRLRGVGGDAGSAASVDGVLAAIAAGSSVDARESVLPRAPLIVSAAASREAFRAKYIGPAFLVVSALAMSALGVFATVGVVNDLRAWHQGVEVPAELKGSITTKLVISFIDVELAYQMPEEQQIRTDTRWFMTLWMADEEAGAVRALRSDPRVVTFEEAVDLVPLRIPLILALFGLAVGAVISARNQRKTAERVAFIAASAVEDRLESPQIVTHTTNGAVTGHTLSGTLQGKLVSMGLHANVDLNALVFADHTDAFVVVASKDRAWWTPLFVDGEPFAWKGADLARAQAVLTARGSSSVLIDRG